jgi:hypothetical protein
MIKAKFVLEKETANTFRYHEIDAAGEPLKQEQAQIGTLYLRKAALNGTKPQFIEAVIKATEID